MLLLGEELNAIFDIWHIAAVKYSIFLEVQFQKTGRLAVRTAKFSLKKNTGFTVQYTV